MKPDWLPDFDPNARGKSSRTWVVSETHHLTPLSWGGSDTNDNKIRLSAQLHFDCHACLNEYVRHKGKPPPSVLSAYPKLAREMAQYAWDHRKPGGPTPFWAPAPPKRKLFRR